MKNALILALCLLPLAALGRADKGQKPQPTLVSITGKGTDVRAILSDLFSQAKQNYVLQPGIQFALFLQLNKIDFEEALNLICAQAKLQFEVQNGIYFIAKAKPAVIAPANPPAPKGTLDKKALARHVTTKLIKADIHAVFAELAKQADLDIEVDKTVPAFKLDARLTRVTLKYALDEITKATGLKYRLTDNLSILVYKPEDTNKVAISGG